MLDNRGIDKENTSLATSGNERFVGGVSGANSILHPQLETLIALGEASHRSVLKRTMRPLPTIFLLLAATGCGSPEPLEMTGRTMGTTYHIKLAALPPSVELPQLQQDVDATLEEINLQMSTYLPESEVSRFNRAPADEWFAVSPATAEVVTAALEVSRETGGALDITVEPLVEIWHFGPSDTSDTSGQAELRPPDQAAIDAARQRVGWERLSVRFDPPALRKSVDGLQIDLSAVAKGYGVDRVAGLLSDRGVSDYMVEIGGEVRAAGRRPDGKPWQIGIERPDVSRRQAQWVVPLVNASLATSGDYRNYFDYKGHSFSHIIDPSTGRPVEHPAASVSVLTDSCMKADAWATAMLVLGPERGYDLAEKRGLAVLFVIHADSGFATRATTAWQHLLPE
jgi:thiamine biosynthesis lipoprotein